MGMDARCPDCGVTMESPELHTGGGHFRLKTDEKAGGVLGSLCVDETLDVIDAPVPRVRACPPLRRAVTPGLH